MKSKIQRITREEEFAGVYKLFEGKKTIEELKWLYSDPNNEDCYNAFIAKTDANEIIGVVGYQTSTFKQGGKELVGVMGFTWKVLPDTRGMHGIMLLKKIFDLGDFVYSMGGTKDAHKFHELFKYREVANYTKYYKILNFKDYNTSLKSSNIKRRIGLLVYLWPSRFLKTKKKLLYENINFINYDKDSILSIKSNMIFEKKIDNNYIDWLLKCPLVKSYAFNIEKDGHYLGVCICFIRKINGVKIGRIVYLPFLGSDTKIWVSVIENCLSFFRKNKCAFVSAIGSLEVNEIGLKKAGFISNSLLRKPMFISDREQKLKNINFDLWHGQFSEGDLLYLGF